MSEVNYPEYLEEDGVSLIEALLARDPTKRPKFEGVKNHSWMRGVEFDPILLKRITIPDWIILHAAVEANPKTVRRRSLASNNNHKKQFTLSSFIRDICTQMVDIGNKVDAESAATRWMTEPCPKTLELFQGWDFVSEDANSMENNTTTRKIGFLKRIKSRRSTNDW